MNRLIKIFIFLLLKPLASTAMVQPAQQENYTRINLPRELHAKILAQVIKSSVLPEKATKAIRAWAHTNHHCYEAVNSADVTKLLLNNLNWLQIKTRVENAVGLRTRGAGQWLTRHLQKGDANQHEHVFSEYIIPTITFGDRKLPLFVLAHVKANPKFVTAALSRVVIDQKRRCRDNSPIIKALENAREASENPVTT